MAWSPKSILLVYAVNLQSKSRGLLNEPRDIHSHGGRVHLVKSGELKIDVAFLGVPCCDTFR